MIGLVIVSHSRPLAKALVKLVRQIASPDVSIALAAGVGENRQTFGTDATEIKEAIQSVFSPDGVLVLMDLGSAVLSAQMALDLIPPEMAEKVRFCSGPLVEGSIAAGVQIGLGSDLDTVATEARHALLPKQDQLGDLPAKVEEATLPSSPEVKPAVPTESITLDLVNQYGLHARPAARFVQTAAGFEANVSVKNLSNGKGPVSARSLNAVVTLGAIKGHRVCISASGADADSALQALKALVESGFGELGLEPTPAQEILPAAKTRPVTEGILQATPVSEGIAVGPLYRYQAPCPPVPEDTIKIPEAEWERLQTALDTARQETARRARQMKQSLGAGEAAIFDAHLLILQDPELIEEARQGIFDRRQNAALAWNIAINATVESYRQLDDAYLQQRAADVQDVGAQVLFALAGKPTLMKIDLPRPVILYAPDLTPTETSQLDMQQVLGVVTAGGGPASHSAILSRALGIPAVAGAGMFLERRPPGVTIAVNGSSGEIWLDPSPEDEKALLDLRAEWLERREKLLQHSQEQALTIDGRRVEVFANIGGLNDARAAVQNGAEGVGLLRTEFLFLTRETPPSEGEQTVILRQIFETLGQRRPVTVRTLDVGGDKHLPYIHLPDEANPFLGLRALRLSLNKPELFLMQLRSILRAAEGFPCRIMFPMVADIEEVRQARTWLEKAHATLLQENSAHAWPVEMGIMVEIPSAALLSPILAREVDFFSIGTNDLTQYTLAAERGNPLLTYLFDGLNPAVLRLIGEVAGAAHEAGKWTGICGELGGDPEAVPILIGLGVDELSLNPAGIPRIKSIIRSLHIDEARSLAAEALRAQTSTDVRKIARAFLDKKEILR